jgi:menaquinone-dependent protoporphyrinogen oxidase
MKLLIVYGTTEGQTRKIARFAADHLLGRGHSVEVLGAADAEGVVPAAYDGVILAGSIHAGRYQAPLVDFATSHAAALDRIPNLFLSVSLSAAGRDEKDWEGLETVLATFKDDTGWTPKRVEHVAGALRYSHYDFLRYWAMRWIASQRGQTHRGDEDVEFTDWQALSALLDDWAGSAG